MKKNILTRKPRIENKYNLKPSDIRKMSVIDRDRLQEKPFWRNDVIHAWCLSDSAGNGYFDAMNEYWIGFYDEDAPAYAGKTRFSVSTYEGMCSYKFNTFYKPSDIDNLADLEIQEKLLDRMNWLLDEGIVKIDGLEIKKDKEEIEQEY